MKNSLFEIFKPKEDKFFPLLSEMATVIQKAATISVDAVQAKNADEAKEYFRKIKEQEKAGDNIQDNIFNQLNNTFVTPFDREDINNLSSTMDDVTDHINSCAKRIMLYKPKEMPGSAKKLAELVKQSSEVLIKAIAELNDLKKNPAKIREYCSQLHAIENEADDVYEMFLINLFENEKDPMEVIKLKDILHELERATDAAETVGKIIKTMIVKYS